MKLGLSLIDLRGIEKSIAKEMVRETNRIVKRALNDIKTQLKELTQHLMERSKFFNELLFGVLAGHFGIPDAEINSTVQTIIQEIVNNIEITYSPLNLSGQNIKGGLKIGIGKNGFASLLSLSEATVTTDKGTELHWLDWVLIRGDAIIISEHDIQFEVGAGRSGLAIMVPDKLASWRVPTEFAGTLQDNIITREILKNIDVYSKLVSDLINKQVKSKIS